MSATLRARPSIRPAVCRWQRRAIIIQRLDRFECCGPDRDGGRSSISRMKRRRTLCACVATRRTHPSIRPLCSLSQCIGGQPFLVPPSPPAVASSYATVYVPSRRSGWPQCVADGRLGASRRRRPRRLVLVVCASRSIVRRRRVREGQTEER